jgi:heme exporter protein A
MAQGLSALMIRSLRVEGLALSRGSRALFEGLSFEAAAGEAVAITGANGAGKTSLLRAIAGLLRPDAGKVSFAGADGAELDPDLARREGLHLMGHLDGLKSTRRAGDELAFQADWAGADAEGRARAIEVLELAPLLDLEVRMLSAGQRRRLALARLVAAPRAVWLLDEPLAPLDAARRTRAGELMQAHLDGGGIILAAVHDPLPVAARTLELCA